MEQTEFRRQMSAMLNFQVTKLIVNFLSTLSLVSSLIVPVVLAIAQGNVVWLLLLATWPVCIFLMGAVKHANAPFWLPGISIIIFIVATPIPFWYILIPLTTVLAYHIQMNELPMKAMKLNQIIENDS
ncbi:MAG: hypothetical protein CBB80_005505 [Synechococcus sp. TMED20]|nr:MAG: hypothetical protein CBB80_005505 [Synechococcus sp. TMED20]